MSNHQQQVEHTEPSASGYIPVAYRLAIVISAPIILGITLLCSFILYTENGLLQSQVDSYGSALSRQFGASVKELILAEKNFSLNAMTKNLVSSRALLGAAILDNDGVVLSQSGAVPTSLSLLGSTRAIDAQTDRLDWDDNSLPVTSLVSDIYVQGNMLGQSIVTFSPSVIGASIQYSQNTIINAIIFLCSIFGFAGFFLIKHISNPIRSLMNEILEFNEGRPNSSATGKPRNEIDVLSNAFNNMANGLLQKAQVEKMLSQFISPSIANHMLNKPNEVKPGGKGVNASVVFADIVEFTQLSEDMEPEQISELLNDYYHVISLAAECYRGTIDKYIGDCAMIVFGTPEPDVDHSFHALACAVMIQQLIERINVARCAAGQQIVQFRIGVNSGPMLAGNLGTSSRMQYTVVGNAVNLASRLAAVAMPGKIIISEEVHKNVNLRHGVVTMECQTVNIRGKREPVKTYQVKGLHPQSSKIMDSYIHDHYPLGLTACA